MPSECDITFDHPNGVYNSGENLNGNIQLRTNTSKSIRGISIRINGYAKVRWTERHSRRRNNKTEHYTVVYSAYDQYLDSLTFVAGSNGGSSFDLAPGVYNHAFYCFLPPGLPTSCQGQYGEIKYEVIVTIDRPFVFDNVFKQGFTIIQPLNLNFDQSLKLPVKTDGIESACCCSCFCGADGKIFAEIRIPFCGFAPGQKIQFELLVGNDSDSDLTKAEVKLKKRITFESRSPTVKQRYNSHEIDSKSFGPILKLTRKEYKDFIQLPSIPPSSTNPAQCIRIDYLLTAAIKTGCCISNIVLTIPIKIGTVPIMESATNPANIITMQPTAPTIDQNNGGATGGGKDLPPGYMSLAPPSYEDSILISGKFENDENDDKHKEGEFVPKYPVYYNFAGAPTAPPDSGPGTKPSGSGYGWSQQNN